MKLRLPHKFQAALLAAIASVSLTTLSSATAYAATSSLEDAELQLVDFTAETMTAAKEAGWTFSDGFTGNESGVYTTTSTVTRIDSNHAWTSKFDDKGSNRTPYAGIITVKLSTLSAASGTLLQDGSGTNAGSSSAAGNRLEGIGFGTENSLKHLYGAWQNNATWGNGKLEIDYSLAQFADANGYVTLGVFYYGTGERIYVADKSDDDTGLKSGNDKPNLPIFLSNQSGVEYANLYLFGAEDGAGTLSISTADMQSMMKEAGSYDWKGSVNGNWDATTTNWAHHGSSVAVAIGANGGNANTNVVFGADATQKTVTLAGATTVGALTVSGGDYTFNLNGNLTTSGITIAEGASLAYTGSGNITGTLAGAGTYVLAASQQALNSGLTIGPDWTGVVRISGTQPTNGWNLATLDNIASTIEFAGVSTYFSDPDPQKTGAVSKLTRDVIFTNAGSYDAAVYFNNGFSRNGGYEFSGKVSGSGTFHLAGTPTYHITFSGDVSDWDGLIKVTNAGSGNDGSWVRFSGNAQTVNVAINKTGGDFRVIANTDATFNKSIAVDKLEVTAGHTATLKETLTLTGDLTLDGSATLEKGGSVGTIDLSHSGNAHGTLTLNAGQTLTYSNSFWGANNNKLLLGEGATVKQASNAPIEIVGLAGESYVSSSANVQFGLTASAYTLHNVKATIKTASSDVQLRFDNSKLVTNQNITLKNLQSVFSGMDIQGGTTTVGASDATGAVTLGAVTLSGGANLAMADHVTGSVSSIDVTGSSAISGGTLSMGGTITTQENAQLTLGGTVLFANGGITSSGTGTLAFGNSVVFDLSQLTEGENHTYTLFTGNAVDLTGLNATAADHITGVITTGRTWTFNNNGQVSYEILSRNLVWNNGAGNWTTDTAEEPWHVSGELQSTYFSNGDAVTFAYTAEPAVATLGSDVTVSTMTLDTDTPNVTVNNDGSHSFSVEVLDIKSGSLTTNTEMAVKSVTIENGGVWNMGGDLDLTAITYSNAGTLNVMDGATVNISKDTDTSAITGAGTVTLSVGTEVIEGYAPTFKEDAPFTGTLVYHEGDISNHNSYVTLDNTFKGTLELRGRMNGHAMNLGGASTLRLVGDRSSNTTGVWSQGAAMTFAQNLEVTGNEQVELWSDGGTIINGTVNSGTVKQGHLTKRENGTMTFNGAVALAEFTTPGGTVNFNSSAALDRININGGTVNLNGGADADYNLGDIYLYSGSLAIGNNGVKSISANEFRVSCTTTLNNAAEAPAVINAVQLDVSNFQTNFTLRNVTLNVSGRATAAELRTDRNADEATVTVGDNATLNLNGGVLWKKTDGAKTDYVNLTIANGGTVAITGAENVLNALTIERGGALTFGAGTSTTVEGTATISEVITALGDITLNGNVNIDGMDDTELTTYVYGKENGNGFKQYGGSLTVVNTTGGGSVSVKEGTVITFKDASGTLDSTGKFTLDSSTVKYDTFCVLANGTSESLTYALSQAEGHGTMTTVQLANGTTLDMDSADAVLQHLVLKDEAAATLNVTQSATIGSVEGLGTAQALNVTGTPGKVLAISTTETMAGALSVTDATLKLNTNLTLAGGLDNAGTIDLNNKALTLNGQEGGAAYTMGTLTNGASSDVTLNNHVAATFDGEATVWRLTGNAGSSVVVGENATLTLASTNRNYYSQVSDLDVKGTISLKGSNGDIRFYGYEDNQVFNLGHLHIDGNSGTTYMLTAGSVNYSTDIVVKSLSGGGANHTLQVSDCYNGGSQGMVIDLIIGETQDSTNLYTGKIQYGIGTGSALAGSGMNLVIKDELVASKAVLDPVFSGNNAQSANITVDTAHAQVKGLTGTVNNARTMQVSGTETGKNRVLEIVGEGNYTYGGKLGANLDVVHSGTGTQSFGGVDGFDGAIDVEAGTLNIMNIAQATSLSVQDVTIKNSTLGVYTNATAAEANEGTLTIKDGHTLTASGANAKLNANLVMESGSTLDVSAYGGTGGLHMGSSITLNPGMFLSDKDMEGVSGLGFMDAYDLKYGVDEFFIGSTQYSEITFASETWVKASEVFSNDGFKDGKDYYVFYSGANPGGNGGNVGTIYIVQVPEPATSTLSLLALAALAARRRRK